MEQLERELKELIIEELMLPELSPDMMDSDAPLMESYGLDSIDVLELAMVFNREYGVEFVQDDDKNAQYFASIHALATYIEANRSDADDPQDGDRQPDQQQDAQQPYEGKKADIYAEIVDGIVDLFDFPREELGPDARLTDDLGLDSLDALDLIVQLQDRFGARIPRERLVELETIDDVVEMTLELSQEASAPAEVG